MTNIKAEILILILIFACFSVEGQTRRREQAIDKTLKFGDFRSIIELYGDVEPDEFAVQFKILGQASLENGDYEKAANYYKKSLMLDDKNVQEKDVAEYYYSLLKSQKAEEVLNDSLGASFIESSKMVRQLIRNAESREIYKNFEAPDVKIKEMEIKDMLSRYGFTFNDYVIYFSYQRGIGDDEELLESNVFLTRVAKRSYLAHARFTPKGELGSEGADLLKFKDKRRVVTLNKSIKYGADFYTLVPENGQPEQIEIRGGDFPPFPYNSAEYACAMPYFDEPTRRLYFSSTMRGGMGGWDIYYTTYNGARWNAPVNMGSEVNSPFDEFFPFANDSLVYFSSDGWEGYGGFDNYVFNSKDDSRTNILFANGPEDDYCFQVVDEKNFQAVGIKGQKPVAYSFDKVSYADLLAEVIWAIDDDYSLERIEELRAQRRAKEKNLAAAAAADRSLSSKEKELAARQKELENRKKELAARQKASQSVQASAAEVPAAAVAPAKERVLSAKEKELLAQEQELLALEKALADQEKALAAQEKGVSTSTFVAPKDRGVAQTSEASKTAVQKEVGQGATAVQAEEKRVVEEIKNTPDAVSKVPFMTADEIALFRASGQRGEWLDDNSVVELTPEQVENPNLLVKPNEKLKRQANTVYFDFNSSVMAKSEQRVLDELVARIKAEEVENVVLWGHADKNGASSYNAYMSYQRALGVQDYIKKGLGDAAQQRFFVIIAGDEYAQATLAVNRYDRRVVVGECGSAPYSVMYAYRASPTQSLADVATLFQNNLEVLKQINDVEKMPDDRLLLVGMQGIHQVNLGETLYRIALKYNCYVEDIQKLNKMRDSRLAVGDKLLIPITYAK
ncbi:MAG: LysM peptidoglycan-binding domain-containing protein [Mangrovibacterium sp.]